MNKLLALLVVLLIALQYRLWFGEGSARDVLRLRDEVALHQSEIQALRERNRALEAEVLDLKRGLNAVEERARSELGMIREGETFYQLVGEPQRDDGDLIRRAPAPAAGGDDPDAQVADPPPPAEVIAQ